MTHVKNFILPVTYQTLVRPDEIVMLRKYDLGPEYAIDFVLNHWMVLFEKHAVNTYDVVQTVLEEHVHAHFPYEAHNAIEDSIEKDLDALVTMFIRIFDTFAPYIGHLPMEFSTIDGYICASEVPHGSDTVVEFGDEDGQVLGGV